MSTCLFPGSFDPPTRGHIDIVRRASKLFDRVFVAILTNTAKTPLCSVDERVDMLKACCAGLQNVSVVTGSGLTVELCRQVGADVLLRGIRGAADAEQEAAMAALNRHISGIETVTLFTSPELSYISSTFVRDIIRYGGSLQGLVPDELIAPLESKRPARCTQG